MDIQEQLDELFRRMKRIERAYDWTTNKVISNERYPKLAQLRKEYVFDEQSERESCRYNKMSDAQFAARCAHIRHTCPRVPCPNENKDIEDNSNAPHRNANMESSNSNDVIDGLHVSETPTFEIERFFREQGAETRELINELFSIDHFEQRSLLWNNKVERGTTALIIMIAAKLVHTGKLSPSEIATCVGLPLGMILEIQELMP